MLTVMGGVRMLCVCTHNRTRSVMMGALFAERGQRTEPPLEVRTGGFREGMHAPTQGAIDILKRNGIDASAHRSSLVTAEAASSAHLILTAEQQHVVSIASMGNGLFDRTFTLPEFVSMARELGPRDGAPLEQGLGELGEERPRGIDYLSTDVGELSDPTGQHPAEWRSSYARINSLVDSAIAFVF